MLLPFFAVIVGLVLLVWSADRFVEGAASTASHFGVPPLLIGMVIVGLHLRPRNGRICPRRLTGQPGHCPR